MRTSVVASALVVALASATLTGASPGQSAQGTRELSRSIDVNGAVSITWASGAGTVTYVGGDPSVQVEIEPLQTLPDGTRHGGASITSTGVDLSRPVADLVAAYARRSPRSAWGDPATAAYLTAHGYTAPVATPVVSSAGTVNRGPIVDDGCIISDWDGDDVHGKTCFVRRDDSGAGSKHYWSDSFTGTIFSNDGQHGDGGCINCDDPNQYRAEMVYLSDNGVVAVPQYAPSGAKPKTNCSTTTNTVSGVGSSATYSSQSTVCKDGLYPWGIGQQTTGAEWKGAGTMEPRGINFVDVFRINSAKGNYQGWRLYHWGWW